jgi:hypothetical protein
MTDTKQQLADDKQARGDQEKQRAERKGKPTPTQEENDRLRLGEHIDELEADGSPPEQKSVEAAKRPGGYQTRATEPAHKK